MEEILALTVVAELPRDLGVEDVGVFAFCETEPWDGWDATSMARLVQYRQPLEDGRRPEYRIVLRRVRVRGQLSLQAADKAFADWVSPLLSRPARMRRRLSYRLFAMVGAYPIVTVAAVTAFLPTRALPLETGPEWTEHRVTLALQVLNEFLVSLGVESQDPRVGPITRADLPALVPITAETQPIPTRQRQGGHWLSPLHSWWPTFRGGLRPIEQVEDAATLFRAVRERRTVWFPVLELTHTAQRDGMAGRYAMAVLGAGTAIEVLLGTLLREVAATKGIPAPQVEGWLQSGFRNVISDHVPRLLGIGVELGDNSTPWGAWWNAGYLLRNRVAHEAYRPTEQDALDAVHTAMALVAEVGAIVESTPGLEHLELGLPTGFAA